MILNFVKLSLFPTTTQTHSFKNDLKQEKENSSRIISILGALLFFIYTVMDYFGLPKETLSILLPLRTATIVMLLGLFYLTYKPIFQKEYNKLHLFAYYSCGAIIAIGTYLSQPGEYSYNLYFAAFIILFMTCFSWSYLPIRQSILMSLTFVGVYSLIKIFGHKAIQGTELLSFISHIFYLTSVIVIASIGQAIRDSFIYRNLKLQDNLKHIADNKTEEAKKHQELANIDELTGIPNRRFITHKLNEVITDVEELTLVFIDLNGFKTINDNYGHDSGDAVLKTTAYRLQQIIRADDYVARLGGDEFLLGFRPSKELESFIPELYKKIKTMVAAPIAYQGNILRVDVSVGYANFPEDGKTIKELIKVADNAMYKDKQKDKTKLKAVVNSIST